MWRALNWSGGGPVLGFVTLIKKQAKVDRMPPWSPETPGAANQGSKDSAPIDTVEPGLGEVEGEWR